METKELIEELQELVQADIDTVHTYNRILDEISDEIIRTRLNTFRNDHIKHVTAVSGEIRSLGGEAPELTKDFKGYVIEAFAALRTAGGMKSALKALRTAENITYRYYENIVSKEMPPELKKRLQQNFSEKKVHLEYIDNNLKVL